MIMETIVAFILGTVFSFLGSVPPGTLNLTVLQLGLDGKTNVALRFAAAVTLVEYPYAWIAVVFESWITSSPLVLENFQLITAVVMTAIGILNLATATKPTSFSVKFDASGFRRGTVLSLLNPMAIPFWIAITAYLRSAGWLNVSTPLNLHAYVFGTSVGVALLLLLFIFLAKKFSGYVQGSVWVKRAPGIVLLVLGLYAFAKYFS